MQRNHDKFYLNEDNKIIKQSFVEVANFVDDNFDGKIADIGCATGAFPQYLKSRFVNSEVTGIEYLDELRQKATLDFPNINFIYGDVTNKSSVNEKYDVLTSLGVLCIFDDYTLALSNILSWLKPKGRLIIHNMISEFDFDVFVKYSSSSENYDPTNMESGWNIVSEKSLSLVARANDAKLTICQPFNLSIDLEPNPDDAMRSWTETGADGHRNIYNATHLRQPQKIAVFDKN